MRLGYSYVIPITTTSTAGARVTPIGVRRVRLCTNAACFIRIGTNPTATLSSDAFLNTGPAEVFTICEGETVACVWSSTGGILSVTELSE